MVRAVEKAKMAKAKANVVRSETGREENSRKKKQRKWEVANPGRYTTRWRDSGQKIAIVAISRGNPYVWENDAGGAREKRNETTTKKKGEQGEEREREKRVRKERSAQAAVDLLPFMTYL